MKPELFLKARCIVGEGPVWDAREHKLYFVDIRGKFFAAVDESGRAVKTPLPQQIGCMALAENGDFVLGLEDGAYRMRADKSGIEKLYDAGVPFLGRRSNDGKVGPDGRFYFGTTDSGNAGAFYRLDEQGLHLLFGGVGCSNGLDWSADGSTMYYCDTVTQTIEIFDFNDGTLKNRRPLTVIPKKAGLPDGFTLDENDNLWVALWGGAKVVCIDHANGHILERIDFPVSKPSCCAFFGNDLDKLVVTSAAFETEISDEPLAGSLFVVDVGVRGKRTYRYTK